MRTRHGKTYGRAEENGTGPLPPSSGHETGAPAAPHNAALRKSRRVLGSGDLSNLIGNRAASDSVDAAAAKQGRNIDAGPTIKRIKRHVLFDQSPCE